MKMTYDYSVPQKWYDGVYKDKKACCSAARSFSLVHEKPAKECWLIIHGYRGYPGEFVRPAEDLFNAGYDVFVPRLPGHGTCGDDFTRTRGDDWMGLAKNAADDLKTRYSKVHLLGHSMGTAMAAIIGCPDKKIGKIVLVCPSFENKEMTLKARVILKLVSPFRKRLNCKWHPSSKYHLHYENAPCDETYLGGEYWRYYFPRQLGDYYRIMKRGLGAVAMYPHEHLVICPDLDGVISVPSVALYRAALGKRANVVMISDGTHNLFYDKNPQAEEDAVTAVLDFAKKGR